MLGLTGEQWQVVGEFHLIHRCVDLAGRPHDFVFSLRVEGVEVRHPTGHVKVDDALGSGYLLERGSAGAGRMTKVIQA